MIFNSSNVHVNFFLLLFHSWNVIYLIRRPWIETHISINTLNENEPYFISHSKIDREKSIWFVCSMLKWCAILFLGQNEIVISLGSVQMCVQTLIVPRYAVLICLGRCAGAYKAIEWVCVNVCSILHVSNNDEENAIHFTFNNNNNNEEIPSRVVLKENKYYQWRGW